MRFLIPTMICLLLTLSNLFAQTPSQHLHEGCGLEQAMERLFEEDPTLKNKEHNFSNALILEIDSLITNKKQFPRKEGIKTVPVVFHLMYDDCETPEDVRDNDRFVNTIDKLNLDFAGETSKCTYDTTCCASYCDSLGVSSIRFALAEKDTLGNPTTGINRIKSGLTNQGLGGYRTLQESIMWPRDQYLNIYVVNKATLNDNSGIAHYPTHSHSEVDKYLDGITMAYWAVDPGNTINGVGLDSARENYDYILTHEVGHWLGLRHIWGDGNSNKKCGNCGIDDFDFIKKLDSKFKVLLDSTNTVDWNSFNDTPNTIGGSIRDNCGMRNTCPDTVYGLNYPGGVTESDTITNSLCDSITRSPDGAIYDMYDNFMDYTPCGKMFSAGQARFMELVLQSSIANRRNLISSENHNQVFYQNPEKRVVFKDYLSYESLTNDGTVNQTLEMNLENVSFDSALNNTVLNSSYYTISPALPNGLTATVIVTGSKMARIEVTGQTSNHFEDVSFTFTFDGSQSPFVGGNGGFPVENRSKVLGIDFIEETGIVYTDLQANATVGPNGLFWKSVPINFFNVISTLYLTYNDSSEVYEMENNEVNDVEFYLNGDDEIITFNKGETPSGGSYSSANATEVLTIDFNPSTLDPEGDFYINFKLDYCGQNEFYGWMRLRYDADCKSLIAIDYGINAQGSAIIAGSVQQPTLLYYPKKITRNNDGSFTGFDIELLRTNSNQRFNNRVMWAAKRNIKDVEPEDSTFLENAIKITKLSDTTAYVTANPNNPFWDNNETTDFDFNLSFLTDIFWGVGNNLVYASDSIIKVLQPETDPLQIGGSNSVADPEAEDEAHIKLPFANYPITAYLGLIYYDDTTIPDNSGYILFNNGGLHYEGLCYPNSNELMLVDYGHQPDNLDDFNNVRTGSMTENFGRFPDELYIPDETVAQLAGQDKYLLYRFFFNCEVYYGWVKLSFSDDGSIMLSQIVTSSIEEEQINAGYLPQSCIPNIERTYHFYIEKFAVPEVSFINDQINDANGGESAYTDYRNSMPKIVLDLGTQPSYLFEIAQETNPNTHDGIPNKGNWYIWVDLNQNGLFSSDELIIHTSNSDSFSEQIVFPTSLSGTYDMRVVASMRELQGYNGCQDFQYGEVEDYVIEFINSCPDELVYTADVPSGERRVDNRILLNTNAYFSAGKNATLIAENYIEMLPNTLIEKYSVFEARIEACESTPVSFPNYPWLEDIVDADACCDVAKITEYSKFPLKYILIESNPLCSNQFARLYYQAGNLACINSPILDCVSFFELSSPKVLWSCVAKTAPPSELKEATTDIDFKVFPNPFSDLFEIKYHLPETENISISIYSIEGKLIKTVIENQLTEAGDYTQSINGADLQSGVYIIHLSTPNKREVKKLIKL